jgi:transposase
MQEVQMKRKSSRRTRTARPNVSLLDRINVDVAGIDCGSGEHFVAVPPDRDSQSVRSFRTFTADLHRLADWLRSCGVRSVAMEATGVYWIPLYEILEQRGFEVLLVNARHVKNVAGRKSDVLDCEWLRELHSVGLLRGSFRPEDAIVVLRGYLRHRDTLVESMSSLIQRMQKALVQMNVRLGEVLTDITGVTGMAIMRDIVEGRTDPKQLVLRRDPRCRASEEDFVAALTGNYRPEHVFVLKQNLDFFEYHQGMLSQCDTAIEAYLQTLAAQAPPPSQPLPMPRKKASRKGHEPAFDVRAYLYEISGADLAQIDGIGPYQALRVVSEIGTDMSPWRTQHHFTAWLTLAPQNKVSGGRLLSSSTRASANRAKATFRMIAMSLARTDTALGAFYRRLAGRIGKAKAITATARKVAILVYRMLKGDLTYQDPGPAAYSERQHTRAVRHLRKRAQLLGFALVQLDTGELLAKGVS